MDKSRPSSEQNLVEWARPYLGERRRFYRLVDPHLEGRFSIKGAQQAVQLAARCLNRDAKIRPAMSEVVEAIEPLINLKDMACSSSYFQAMNISTVRAAGLNTPSARNGAKLQPIRSPSMSSRRGSPFHNIQPLQSPLANNKP
ncbi:receptor-like serine/threonine-protein kinase at3g01300 [Phtheirospermum japonicum]|uniref:Receptor-like serine/threonine-protein kinase at3g01300 n=1 Tax=Phtheirospermum japonicum TaxID=374723 RepID=A0A830B2T5_9LAMI|nr:receptor-like serine/threonine-protein kinase at3g01300 [Phtheirospermum japonicum]